MRPNPVDYDVQSRQLICSTDAIESVNARYRRAVKAPGHCPTEQAALEYFYPVIRSLDPTGKGRPCCAAVGGQRSIVGWRATT